jgi:hypothetical protein
MSRQGYSYSTATASKDKTAHVLSSAFSSSANPDEKLVCLSEGDFRNAFKIENLIPITTILRKNSLHLETEELVMRLDSLEYTLRRVQRHDIPSTERLRCSRWVSYAKKHLTLFRSRSPDINGFGELISRGQRSGKLFTPSYPGTDM